ncbi:MAG: SDR family oxidoreductase [Chloroflexi bacterium]|nr:SDR family oxidoreductase [Chloroflexota bacterium]
MTSDFAGRVAIVTGAGRGMGRAVAARLAAGGAKLVVNDLDADSAERAAGALQESGAEALATPGDVTSSADVARMVASAIEHFGRIDVLVNNAGVLRPTPVFELEEEEWDMVVNGNLKSTYLCSRAVLPAMRDQGWGRIVNFSSTAGKSVSTVGGAHYTASKAAILGFTRHLAKEEAAHGITVNAVCPGLIDTEMVRSTISKERTAAYASSFPIARLGEPYEVAELVAFLASDKAAYITGASLDINGGDLTI